MPSTADLPSRVATVLAVLYLVFNEGYLASGADADPVREDLCREAIRLTRQLREVAGALGPQPEVDGLLALMLLIEARRPARVADGTLVTLEDQDRTRWDRRAHRRGARPGPWLSGAQPAGSLPAAGRDQRRAHRRASTSR